MEKIFTFSNGNLIMKTDVYSEVSKILVNHYPEGAGNATYHAIKYIMSLSDEISIKFASRIIDSVKSVKSC